MPACFSRLKQNRSDDQLFAVNTIMSMKVVFDYYYSGKGKSAKHLYMQNDTASESDYDSDRQCSSVSALSIGKVEQTEFVNKPWFITVFVKNKKLKLEFDSGTEATILPSKWYDKYFLIKSCFQLM